MFEVKPGEASFWEVQAYKPLLVGVCFPFFAKAPWKLKGTPRMIVVTRQVRHELETGASDASAQLRKIFKLHASLNRLTTRTLRQVFFYESKE